MRVGQAFMTRQAHAGAALEARDRLLDTSLETNKQTECQILYHCMTEASYQQMTKIYITKAGIRGGCCNRSYCEAGFRGFLEDEEP